MWCSRSTAEWCRVKRNKNFLQHITLPVQHYKHPPWGRTLKWSTTCLRGIPLMISIQKPMQPFSISLSSQPWHRYSRTNPSSPRPFVSEIFKTRALWTTCSLEKWTNSSVTVFATTIQHFRTMARPTLFFRRSSSWLYKTGRAKISRHWSTQTRTRSSKTVNNENLKRQCRFGRTIFEISSQKNCTSRIGSTFHITFGDEGQKYLRLRLEQIANTHFIIVSAKI